MVELRVADYRLGVLAPSDGFRSRRKRRRINDDATIARPEILLAAVGNPALSHSTTYPRSASLTSRRGSRPIPRFLTIAVGTPITGRPPHRTVRAAFLHTAPTSDV